MTSLQLGQLSPVLMGMFCVDDSGASFMLDSFPLLPCLIVISPAVECCNAAKVTAGHCRRLVGSGSAAVVAKGWCVLGVKTTKAAAPTAAGMVPGVRLSRADTAVEGRTSSVSYSTNTCVTRTNTAQEPHKIVAAWNDDLHSNR